VGTLPLFGGVSPEDREDFETVDGNLTLKKARVGSDRRFYSGFSASFEKRREESYGTRRRFRENRSY
jgi:hypothetical protein